MAEESSGFNILSKYKKNVAWKIKDTYTSVPDIPHEWGKWGKGKAGVDYGIDYERRLNPIERTNLHTNVDSDAYPINPEGDFRDPTATNYNRDDNIRKQKTKSIINQKFQSKGKTKLLKKQNFGYGRVGPGNFVHGDAKEQRLKNPQYKVKGVTDFKHLGRVAPLSDTTLSKMKNQKLKTAGALDLNRSDQTRKQILNKNTDQLGKPLPEYQSKGKKSLLTKQSTRSKGGGKSGGGGGGKFGIINRALGGRSPWNLLRSNKNY